MAKIGLSGLSFFNMHMIKQVTYIIVFCFTAVFASCSEKEVSKTSLEPENLIVNITVSEDGSGLVDISANADNTIEYRFLLGLEEELIESNETGVLEYTFIETGSYSIQIRAYGESGRYIKETRQITVTVGDDTISIGDGYETPLEYDGYDRVWSDEFNESSINSIDWIFETGAGGWGNNEWQYYRKENAWVEKGTLIIEARKEDYSGSSYTSTRMITKGKRAFKYGRVDIRALLPEGQGIWPALWMLGGNISSVGWPQCGEIDIMEMLGGNNRENTVYGTLHWDDNGEHASSGESHSLTTETFNDKYHVFSIIWDETKITWYVDDIQFNTIDITPAELSEFHQSYFFLFNVAVGGNWPGYPDNTTIFPQKMKVDYIRVFQKK